jgi:alkylation response protein AidB-like acyl-CoA dehydrogenase
MAQIQFEATRATLVGTLGDGDRVLAAVHENVLLAIAAERAGGLRVLLELCVEHAKNRHQFGVPIGAFQAVAHKVVDIFRQTEFTAAAVQYAAAAKDAGRHDSRSALDVAAAYSSSAYVQASREAIHIHGGIGFTWEHVLHRYYRHAWSTQQLFGNATFHRLELAKRLGL